MEARKKEEELHDFLENIAQDNTGNYNFHDDKALEDKHKDIINRLRKNTLLKGAAFAVSAAAFGVILFYAFPIVSISIALIAVMAAATPTAMYYFNKEYQSEKRLLSEKVDTYKAVREKATLLKELDSKTQSDPLGVLKDHAKERLVRAEKELTQAEKVLSDSPEKSLKEAKRAILGKVQKKALGALVQRRAKSVTM